MSVKKRAAAFTAAILLTVVTVSGPVTASAASVQDALPEDLVSGNGLESSVSADGVQDPVIVSADEILPQDGPAEDEETVEEQELSGEMDSLEGDADRDKRETLEGIIEEGVEASGENASLDIDDTGYTGRVDLQDLQDQEKLDRALADGLVELIPNMEEVQEGYQRAGAAGGNIIDVASREVGVSGRPNKYTYWLGSISGTYSYAWCHAFVSWCGAQVSGDGQIPRTASCFYGAQEFKARGQWQNRISGYVPKAGDIIYFDWNANGGYDHVGIVDYVSGGRVHTIEGNAGDAVKYDGGRVGGYALTDSQIIGYGTPAYAAIPQTRGCLDVATGGSSSVTVKGWAFDETDPAQALDIHVYVGGTAGSGAPGYVIKANKARADVGAAYPGMGNNHGFDASIVVNKSGSQPVYVYAISVGEGRTNPLIGSSTVNIQKDTEKPVISNVQVSDISVEGYTVTCKVSDNVGIKEVKFPSWHELKSGDQAVWFEGTVKDGTAECFIPIEQLGGQSGTYTTHIYAYDLAGNYSTATAKNVSIDHTSLEQYNAKNISSGFIARIESESSGKALTRQEDGLAVVSRGDTGADSQIWDLTRDADNNYMIRSKSDGAYLAGSDLGVSVVPENGEAGIPLWRILQAGEDSYYLELVNGGGYVLTQGDGEGDAPIFMQMFGATGAQRFKIQKLSTNVKKLTLKKDTLTFTEAKQTEQLTVSISPKTAADEKILWASSNKKVASVDKNGVVTAVGNGTADITASTEDGSISVICRVTVAIKATGVKLDKTKVSFTSKGATKKLLATVAPKNAEDQTVTWSSSNKKVASVDQTGLVKAVANGTAVITVETVDGKKMATCNATVQIPKVGAGGTVKKGAYTYSADHIVSTAGNKTVIYRQKKGKSKEKVAQIAAKVYIRTVYNKKLYYEKAAGSGKRDLYAMDIQTFKKKLVRRDSVIVGNYGRRFIVRPYAAKTKPQSYHILNVATGRAKEISASCLGAAITKSKVYYVEAVSGKKAKGWRSKVRSCSLSAGKKKDITGKIAVAACEEITAKYMIYQSGGKRYQYTYTAKKRQKLT